MSGLLRKLKNFNRKTQKKQIIFFAILLLSIPTTVTLALHAQDLASRAYESVNNFPYVILNGKIISIPYGMQNETVNTGFTGAKGGAIPTRSYMSPSSFLQQRGVTASQQFPQSTDLMQAVGSGFTVGNQRDFASCTSWAIDYYLRGWYEKKYHRYENWSGQSWDPLKLGGFAPMFSYSQYCTDTDKNPQNHRFCGVSVANALDDLSSQGVSLKKYYTQGDYDAKDQPTQGEINLAKRYAITDYSWLFSFHNWQHLYDSSQNDPTIKSAIEDVLSKGTPIVIVLPLFSNWNRVSNTNFEISLPKNSDHYGLDNSQPIIVDGADHRADHSLFVYGYNSSGVWVLNQWGNWGRNGGALIDWDYITQYAYEAVTIQVPAQLPPENIGSQLDCVAQGGTCINPRNILTFKGCRYINGKPTQEDPNLDNSCDPGYGTGEYICCMPVSTNPSTSQVPPGSSSTQSYSPSTKLTPTSISMPASGVSNTSNSSLPLPAAPTVRVDTCEQVLGQKCSPIHQDCNYLGSFVNGGSGQCSSSLQTCCKPLTCSSLGGVCSTWKFCVANSDLSNANACQQLDCPRGKYCLN